MDGRTLRVLTGLTGHPPKWYEIPVPDADGGPPTVHAYLREAAGHTRRMRLIAGWVYVYVPEGRDRSSRWPWARRRG
ncbi:hypothetical protein SRB5_38370 [Streptomyces sp. RB5]|uniref:Uncharacterized protein n=1 Tax=Streptomyces smaragdinus TaxID=2585196 RepID=A0A7K0CJP6_9ACTN|nr:hypothetical protein [Streptomyces smaragdinus]MQY13687.1 hypothetical protein [Streptomyces smaragdinus]